MPNSISQVRSGSFDNTIGCAALGMPSRPDRFPRLFSAWGACHLPPWWAPRKNSAFFQEDNHIPKDHPGLSRSSPFLSLFSCSGSLVRVPSDPDPDFSLFLAFLCVIMFFPATECSHGWFLHQSPSSSFSPLPSSLSQCRRVQLISNSWCTIECKAH